MGIAISSYFCDDGGGLLLWPHPYLFYGSSCMICEGGGGLLLFLGSRPHPFLIYGSSSLQLAEAAKAQFSRDYSDHLALVRAYEGWKDAERDLAGYEYCWKNFLSAQSMKAIDALRREFYSLLRDAGLVDSTTTTCDSWSYDVHLLRAVICYGLYPGICSVVVSQWHPYLL